MFNTLLNTVFIFVLGWNILVTIIILYDYIYDILKQDERLEFEMEIEKWKENNLN